MPQKFECSYFNANQCRSCSLLEETYEDTLQFKQNDLVQFFDSGVVHEIVPSPVFAGYRNKAKFAFGFQENQIRLGVYDRNRRFQELENCSLHFGEINSIAKKIAILIQAEKIRTFDVLDGSGELKYLLMYQSQSTDEVMVRFVAKSDASRSRLLKVAESIQNEFAKIKVVSLNIQPEHKAIIEGDEEIILSKQHSVENFINGHSVKLGSRSFFQVNSFVAEKLYATAVELLRPLKPVHLMDLYCGVGCFSLQFAGVAQQIVGVEISQEAAGFANESAKQNGFKNMEFVAGDAELVYAKSAHRYDTLIVNPPRRGLGKQICKIVEAKAPLNILYSSCNMQSLRADLADLHSYEVTYAQGFDMFPMTQHLEVLVLLKRIN